jgi:protein-L-isoaspartate(D-aspartate) O-methyltransferase
VERIESLARRARENLERAGCAGVQVMVGAGTRGHDKEAPYDRILVTAGAPRVPQPLIDQLKTGGKLLIPVGGRFVQDLIRVEKEEGHILRENLGGCAFVPLIGEHGW